MTKVIDIKPHKLISDNLILQIAEKVVAKYAYAGTIPKKEMEDVKMAIIEKFLEKEDKISQGFKGQSKITTYCIAVLNRMCCEIIRRDLKHWDKTTYEHKDYGSTSHISSSAKLIISDEVQLLNKLLILFGNDQYKLIVFLAFYYQFPTNKIFVSNYDSNYIKNQLLYLLEASDSMSKGEIFKVLSQIVNLVEKKNNKPDAIRMWLNKYIDQLIIRLNGSFSRASYTKESFQILFEYFYFEENNKDNIIETKKMACHD